METIGCANIGGRFLGDTLYDFISILFILEITVIFECQQIIWGLYQDAYCNKLAINGA